MDREEIKKVYYCCGCGNYIPHILEKNKYIECECGESYRELTPLQIVKDLKERDTIIDNLEAENKQLREECERISHIYDTSCVEIKKTQ